MLNPSPSQLAPLLQSVRTIAVLGAKDAAGQPVDKVGRYLIEAGFTVIPVHPKRKNVWGLTTYTSLAELAEARPDVQVDCVDLFRASQFCADHAKEALALPNVPKLFWMQSGIRNAEARTLMENAGASVVEDECLMVVHKRLKAGGELA